MTTEEFTADTAESETSSGGFFYLYTLSGDITITQDAFVGTSMQAVNGGYMQAQTSSGDLCYTCTGICSWTDTSVTGIGGAFYL